MMSRSTEGGGEAGGGAADGRGAPEGAGEDQSGGEGEDDGEETGGDDGGAAEPSEDGGGAGGGEEEGPAEDAASAPADSDSDVDVEHLVKRYSQLAADEDGGSLSARSAGGSRPRSRRRPPRPRKATKDVETLVDELRALEGRRKEMEVEKAKVLTGLARAERAASKARAKVCVCAGVCAPKRAHTGHSATSWRRSWRLCRARRRVWAPGVGTGRGAATLWC